MNYNVNKNKSLCSTFYIPTIQQYLSATNLYGITLVSAATILFLSSLAIFLHTLRRILQDSPPKIKPHSIFVIAVYPVTSLVTYLAILVPRAHLLAEAITQGMFMAGMYQLFCLFIVYCGGEGELIKKIKSTNLNLKVAPCCCYPCCVFFPKDIRLNKRTLTILRLSVLQLPLIQGLVYLVLLVMWAERESLYEINYMYLQPVVIVSILFGIWSMAIFMEILKESLQENYLIMAKFMVLQMVLILAKMQGLLTKGLVFFEILPCKSPITPQVYANLLHNILMLIEMVCLGLIAGRLYMRKLPENDRKGISTIGRIMGANNNFGGFDNKGVDLNV